MIFFFLTGIYVSTLLPAPGGGHSASPPFRKRPTCQQLGSQEQRPRFITTVSTLTRCTRAPSPRVPQFTPQMKRNWTWTSLESPEQLASILKCP